MIRIPEPTDAQIAACKELAGEGNLFRLSFLDGAVIVLLRPPNRTEFRRFKDAIQKTGEARFKASETLAASCTLYPDKAQLETLADARPGLLESIAGEVLELGGMQNAGEKKAL